jgi:hypothetical protein
MAREILNLRAERDAAYDARRNADIYAQRYEEQAMSAEAEHEQRQLHDDGNARIGVRMSAYFRLDEDRAMAAEQTIAAARGTMIDAAGEQQLRQLVDSVIAYQKENAQLFEVNEQLADVIENFIAAQGTSKEDDAYTALCAYPKNLNKQSYE